MTTATPATTPTTTAPEPAGTGHPLPARSPGNWTLYLTVLRWKLLSVGPMLPVVIVLQIFMAAGIILGFALLIPGIDDLPDIALHMSTGAPTVQLLTVGLVMVPQAVATERNNGTFAYMRSLPVPRPILLIADLTMWTVVALPGLAASLVVALLRFELSLDPHWPLLISAALLVSIMSATVGYAIAVVLRPMVAQAATQALIFFILLFSPVTFPASHLPRWLEALHDWLPIRPAADLLRAGLASGDYTWQTRDLIILLVWTAVSLVICLRALSRR
ncbi:ABC transporter permease [Actinomyces bowdenii]|uniref:ABC transporter permease n=1 Tax=Actinomyces bowdenii TaxID=131109 RepID=A0A853EGY6_9ACTO|nr:ABC transporter permease [Actinomyces bowdenii]MBF0696425.1 ABC transporter permease [Actinomyces bowdenii]NYS68598.1 ABC transporter permease [Actinomyces bowdenii]